MKRVFVTGGTGFIGREVVRVLAERGDAVCVLARNQARARRRVPASGRVELVSGDLLVPGAWQQVARACDAAIHLAQPETFGARITRARAERYRTERLAMDRNLLDALRGGRAARLVYVGGTSFYGHQGTALVDETARPNPRGWGPFLAPAIEQLERTATPGLEVVQAYPGYVYGDGSWFREYVILPLRTGRRVPSVGGPRRRASPVHVRDCARALAHLLARGEAGRRYFVVDDAPVELAVFYERAARAMGRTPRYLRVPPWVLRVLLGRIAAEGFSVDAVLSNARLRATGFELEFASSEQGVPEVIANAR